MHAQNYLPCLIEFTLVFNIFINSYRILYNISDQIHSHPFPSSFQINSLSPLCVLFFCLFLEKRLFQHLSFLSGSYNLSPILLQCSLSLTFRGTLCCKHINWGRAPLVGWSRHFDLFWFSMVISVYCKRSVRIRGEPGTYLQGQDKVLAHRHHSGLGNISSPLGATGSPATGSCLTI